MYGAPRQTAWSLISYASQASDIFLVVNFQINEKKVVVDELSNLKKNRVSRVETARLSDL